MEPSSQTGSGGVNGRGGLSRAEKFEDEKKRIIESCFVKEDDDGGGLLESYITHIRIIEDATYPSTPPPPNSSPETKKPRVIIVAVRKSGRVRMHKARENGNLTFSIGKTWQLDDLSAVQSYSTAAPGNPLEEQYKQWAAGVGFTVILGKPYYWQANSPKEKQFFIASLVKIYTKYTGGKSPELLGFEQRERDQLLGGASQARGVPPQQQQAPPPGPVPMPPYGQASRAQPRREPSREPMMRNQPSREALQRPPQMPSSAASSFTSQTQRQQPRSRGEDSPGGSVEAQGNSFQQTNLRRLAGTNQSQDSFATRSDDANSLPPRSRGGMNGTPNVPGRFPDNGMTPNSQRAMTPEVGQAADASNIPSVPAPLTFPPERRRPPMPVLGDSRQRGQNFNDNIVPAPLASPAMRRDDLRLPTRSSERSQTRQIDAETEFGALSPSGSAKSRVVDPPLNQPEYTTAIDVGSSTDIPVINRPGQPMEPTPPSVDVTPASVPEEDDRPGLGPMIKKKSKGDVANTFLRAAKTANAFSAFKPRAGGAAERLREAQAKSSGAPDGISGVVPAPSLSRTVNEDSSVPVTPTTASFEKSALRRSGGVPEVKITVPETNRPNSVEGPIKPPALEPPAPEAVVDKPKGREPRRQKPPRETMAKELLAIGIDPAIIGDRGGELVSAWEEFGWVGEGMRTRNVDEMKFDVEKELDRMQAGGWLKMLGQEDERVGAIQTGLSTVMNECDELDGLLTLYGVELGTLNEDIAYIEAQSQGLQVQTANQKLLYTELKSLLDTIAISPSQLACLREVSLESPRGIEEIESSLVVLFKAMLTIEPSLSSSGRPSEDGSVNTGKPGGFGNSEIGSMRVLQEKKDIYREQCAMFLSRLKTFLQLKFGAAVDETRKALENEKGNSLARSPGKAKLDPRDHDLTRNLLWRYSPLMLFSREIDRQQWEDLIKMYESVCKNLYQNEFREAIFAMKRIARKPTGDESELLFTSQVEKQTEGIATTARKLTVKRSQTLAKSLRSPVGDNSSKTSVNSDGRPKPFEVFTTVLDEVIPIISMEQNFIIEFFHVSSLGQHDFPDAVASASPVERFGVDLRRARVMDPNRDLALLVIQSVGEIYSFFPGDLQSLVDWCLQPDPLQGVGIMAAIERKLSDLEESNQEYLSRTLQKLHGRMLGLFKKFLDEQVRAIEETKVKIKKRTGVIAFIRIFPAFSASLESMLTSSNDLEVRRTVNDAYVRINKAMFESLKFIARENPSAQTVGPDLTEKDAVNYQVLLIENMNHYLEEVKTQSNPILEDWKQNAAEELDEHMLLYIDAAMHKWLEKTMLQVDNTENLMSSQQIGDSLNKITRMVNHTKDAFTNSINKADPRNSQKIKDMKEKIEKHFKDIVDPVQHQQLILKVLSGCVKYYDRLEDRILIISRNLYDGEVIVPWTKSDVAQAFKRDPK